VHEQFGREQGFPFAASLSSLSMVSLRAGRLAPEAQGCLSDQFNNTWALPRQFLAEQRGIAGEREAGFEIDDAIAY
jgi:hypothetical protein